MRWVGLDFPVTGSVTIRGVPIHGTVISRDPLTGELWMLNDGADPVAAVQTGRGYAIYAEEFTPDDVQKALSLLTG